MIFDDYEVLSCDVLIIGGGGAGLTAAIEARERGADVILASKSRVGYGNNTYISKAIFAASASCRDVQDDPELHVKDTVSGGRFINDQRLLSRVAGESRNQIPFLKKCGVKFLMEGEKVAVSRAPGHSLPRQVRTVGAIGSAYTIPMRAYASRAGVRFFEKVFITRLLTSNGRLTAATGLAPNGKMIVFRVKCAVLATGGYGQIYLQTNNASGITGDGQALALDIGVPLMDMEFVQFYPTALGHRGGRILLYEAFVLGAKASLKNARGEDIITRHDLGNPMDLTRDRLSRAIMAEILEGRGVEGGVILDISNACQEMLDPLKSMLPFKTPSNKTAFIVSPTTHFCMGGIVTDDHAETVIPGLFAAGESVAGTHGANRLAGNALAEVFAMGRVAGKHSALRAAGCDLPVLPEKEIKAEREGLKILVSTGDKTSKALRFSLKEIMWFKAGIIRDRNGLEGALDHIGELKGLLPRIHIENIRELIKFLELRNMLALSEVICRTALERTESRGAHCRSDYPHEDNENWLKNIVLRQKGGEMHMETVPANLEKFKPE